MNPVYEPVQVNHYQKHDSILGIWFFSENKVSTLLQTYITGAKIVTFVMMRSNPYEKWILATVYLRLKDVGVKNMTLRYMQLLLGIVVMVSVTAILGK